ncbi:beta-glucan synthesis-associated protein-domain-containing protein [Pholiota molesta]|nr:beta-glucan synthesis-associated protein-domain-containing protein [Pholiota molesta]
MSGSLQSSPSATSLLFREDVESRASGSTSQGKAQYALSPSPLSWGMPVDINTREPDDNLHTPDPIRDRKVDKGGSIFTARGVANLGCLFIITAGCAMLFAGTNASGQVPDFATNFQLIDHDTPASAYSRGAYTPGSNTEYVLDGRSFYPGDDPFWEAVNLHYWGTNDLEWYDPGQPTTQGGALRLTIAEADPINNHNMSYTSGMVSPNKFCFTGGIVEASVTLPGSNTVSGLWPAVWAMGNLGLSRWVGGSLDGLWPYSYDNCDVGRFRIKPACTCTGESHPGPVHKDGTYVGRSAPEIDVFEALVGAEGGEVSLSAQWAPYNAAYTWKNNTANLIIIIPQKQIESIRVYQQTTSGLSLTNPDCYELAAKCFTVYGFEYKPGFDDGYITWINDGTAAWTLNGNGMGADTLTEIGARQVPGEPMYLIANLGFSQNFAAIDLTKLTFPATMSIDYIRIYQPKDSINIGCDPPAYPTAQYIETYGAVYTNPNLTTWEQAGQSWPKNRLANGGTC